MADDAGVLACWLCGSEHHWAKDCHCAVRSEGRAQVHDAARDDDAWPEDHVQWWACWHCNDPGHFQRDCPLLEDGHDGGHDDPPALRRGDTGCLACWNCKSPFHFARDCAAYVGTPVAVGPVQPVVANIVIHQAAQTTAPVQQTPPPVEQTYRGKGAETVDVVDVAKKKGSAWVHPSLRIWEKNAKGQDVYRDAQNVYRDNRGRYASRPLASIAEGVSGGSRGCDVGI